MFRSLSQGVSMKSLAVSMVILSAGLLATERSPKLGARVVMFQASPSLIKPGEPVELQWMVSGADTVRIEPYGSEQPPTGKVTVNPTGQTVFWIHAYNEGGGESVPLEVNLLRPITVNGQTPEKNAPSKSEPEKALTESHPIPEKLTIPEPVPLLATSILKNPEPPPEEDLTPLPLNTLPLNTLPPNACPSDSEPSPERIPGALPEHGQTSDPTPVPLQTSIPTQPQMAESTAVRHRVIPGKPRAPVITIIERTAPIVSSAHTMEVGSWIQFVALYDTLSAQEMKQRLEKLTGHEALCLQVPDKDGKAIQRLRMGPFPTRTKARARLKEIRAKISSLKLSPQVVND